MAGTIFDAGTAAKYLTEANRDIYGRRTWSQLYGATDVARQQQVESLQGTYADTVAEAYAAAYKQEGLINQSPLSEGFKADQREAISEALRQAYDANRAQYISNLATVEQNAAKAESQVTGALQEQAEYVSKMQNIGMYREYLQSVLDKMNIEYEDIESNPFVTNELLSRYVTREDDDLSLISEEELAEGLFNNDGELTLAGVDFYDQMMNQFGLQYGEQYDFYNWLAKEDEDLYNWARSYNPYDYTEDILGQSTNLGSFKTMVGLTAKDNEYTFIERFGGLSEEQLNNKFEKFISYMADLDEMASNGRNADKVANSVKGMVGELEDLAANLGISEDVQKELGITWNDLSSELQSAYNSAVSSGEMWSKGFTFAITRITTGASLGAFTGAKIGSTAGPAGTVAGGIGGAILGTILAIVRGIPEARKEHKDIMNANQQIIDDLKGQYTYIVKTMIDYAQAKRRQKEIELSK